MTIRRSHAAAALLAAGALTLSACATNPDDAGSGSSDGETGGGGILNMQIGEPRSFIPGGSGESEGFRIIKNIYDGLVYYDAETGDPDLLLAEDISSDDNTVWTIKIKPDTTFHNGEPVNADAFIRSWNRTAYGPSVLPLNYFFSSIEGYADMNPEQKPEEDWADPDTPEFEDAGAEALSGLEKVDDYTLQVTLNEPFIGFSTMLGYEAFYPVAEECLADTDACEKTPIGNGPFIVEGEYDITSGGSFVTWDDYQGERPSIDGVNYRAYLEGSDCWADFLTGDIDVCRPTAANYEQAVNDPELGERRIQMDGTSILMLNFPNYDDLYADANMRRAISVAVDREAVINVIGPDRFTPFDSWVPSSILGGGQGACGEYCTYDPDLAADLLEEAGGWPEGEKLKIWVNDASDNVDVFRAIGDSISNTLGIEYEMVTMEWPDYLVARESHKVDGPFRDGWGPDYNLNENYLDPIYGGGESVNDAGYESADFDEAMAAAAAASTLEESVTLYQEAEKILANDFPSAPLFVANVSYFYSERVDNIIIHPIYDGPGGDAELRDIVINQ